MANENIKGKVLQRLLDRIAYRGTLVDSFDRSVKSIVGDEDLLTLVAYPGSQFHHVCDVVYALSLYGISKRVRVKFNEVSVIMEVTDGNVLKSY